ncbi:MAG: molybdenum cofactor guanylyltransferase MobA [Acidiferrobacteraceae bacterium]|nr:molybdenum cofactor guanylyltransferase MobA [Acidiferrobacteraceae bacterium]
MKNSNSIAEITAVVLAGGRGSRMGGRDKGLVVLNGQPMIMWVIARLAKQVSDILINANRSESEYASLGYSIVPDESADYRGPLAGVASALAVIETPWLVTVPCDTPFVPFDLVERLYDRVMSQNLLVAAAHDGDRLQPVFSIVHRTLLKDLNLYLNSGGRKIDAWFDRHDFAQVEFQDSKEAFVNINDQSSLEKISKLLDASNVQ